jgi:hypothetical protein
MLTSSTGSISLSIFLLFLPHLEIEDSFVPAHGHHGAGLDVALQHLHFGVVAHTSHAAIGETSDDRVVVELLIFSAFALGAAHNDEVGYCVFGDGDPEGYGEFVLLILDLLVRYGAFAAHVLFEDALQVTTNVPAAAPWPPLQVCMNSYRVLGTRPPPASPFLLP